jgi:putative membrane protein
MMRWFYEDYGGWGWMMGFGGMMMLAVWILIIIGIVYLVKFIARSSNTFQQSETALDILKKRYANGEITKDQFEQMKKDIL